MVKFLLIATLLYTFAFTVQAQQMEQFLLIKSDSALLEWRKKIDTKAAPLESTSSKTLSKTDSIQKKLLVVENPISSLNDKAIQGIDSLKPDLSRFNHKMDSLKGKISHRIDSLKNLSLPTEKYSQLLDSLNKRGPVKDIKEAEVKLAAFQTKMNEPYHKANQSVNNLNNKVNEKLSIINKAGGNIPGTIIQSVKLSGTTLPNLSQSSGMNNPLSGTNLSSTNLNTSENKLKGIGTTPGFNFNKPKIEIPNVDMQKSLSEVKEVTGKMNGYSKDLKNITSGNPESLNQLSKDAEKQVLKLNELKGLQQNQAELTKYEGMMGQIKDADAMKNLGKQEIQKQAFNHFAGKEQMLQQAMDKLSSYKLKYHELASLKDTILRRPNAMHGKTLRERIIPGFTMQFINSKDFTMDLNMSLAYRISGKINAGAGWVERIYVSNWQMKRGNTVYGVRSFGEFRLKKGLWFRAEGEYINAMIPQQNPGVGPTDSSHRLWEWNVATGLKTDFQIYKGIRGNVQTLYRIWSNEAQSPYPERLIVRMGFEFPMRKK